MPGFLAKNIISINDGPKISTRQGRAAKTKNSGEQASSSGSFAVAGDAQARTMMFRGQLVNSAVMTEIFVNGVNERLLVDAFSGYQFRARFLAKGIAGAFIGEYASFIVEGLVRKNFADGGGAAQIFGLTKTTLVLTDGTLPWDVDVVAGGAVNEDLVPKVQGDTGTTVRWTCKLELEEIGS